MMLLQRCCRERAGLAQDAAIGPLCHFSLSREHPLDDRAVEVEKGGELELVRDRSRKDLLNEALVIGRPPSPAITS